MCRGIALAFTELSHGSLFDQFLPLLGMKPEISRTILGASGFA
jgi:hypothetical protein